MATAVVQVQRRISQLLQCPICLDTFKKPKLLPCGHTYCTPCIQSHINNKLTQSDTEQRCFPCPVCRADTIPPNPEVEIDKWAESFPVSNMVISLLDVAVERDGDNLCDLCLNRNRKTPAISYCQDCNRAMCGMCKEVHGDIPSANQHVVVDFNAKCESTEMRPNLSFIEMCPRHSDKHIEFLCSDHYKLCCSTCGFLEHRKCDTITSLKDMLRNYDSQTKSKELENILNNLHGYLKNITAKVGKSETAIVNDKKSILQEIRNVKSQLNAKLNNLEVALMIDIEGKHKSENLNLHSLEARGHSLMTAIDSDRTQLDLVMKHGSEVQKVIMLHNLDQNQHRYVQTIDNYRENVIDVRLTLDVDETFRDLAKSLKKLGRINVIRRKPDLPPCPHMKSNLRQRDLVMEDTNIPKTAVKTRQPELECESEIALPKTSESNAVKVSAFCVKISSDENACAVSDVLQLEDTRLMLVDYINLKLKLFGPDYECTDVLVCPDRPWNTCPFLQNYVAVTIPRRKKIQIIRISGKMQNVREFRTRLECYGIETAGDLLAITTGRDQHCILILDMDGTEIRMIRQENYESEKLFGPMRIATNATKTVLYVSYHFGNRLVAYNSSWDALFTYTDPEMKGPAGVDTDRDGNIYLCGYNSDCVQQISVEGKLIKTLTEKKKPFTIRFDRGKTKIILTAGKSNSAEVLELLN